MYKYLLTKLFFIIIVIDCFTINAQTITLKGSVNDSLQNPLSYANIIAKPADVTKNLQFSITDSDGMYKLELTKNNAYTISVSYMGYKTANFKFTATENTQQHIVLKDAPNQLQEVVIEMPVTVKEDTITYNTSKFVTGEERKLKNVLKKLPGVEVDKNGGVTVQGKKVTTLLVEGKKFFGGGSKLAVENIPANAIDKVQVIDNYNEIAFLKNVSDTDEMAMNILLKEDKKQFAFGDIEAGKGNQDFYRSHSNLFYYSPKTNVNFIGNLNNTGEKTFTFRDYMSFQGGVNAVFSSNFNFRGDGFNQFLENRDLVNTSQRFGALNISKRVSKKIDISGYAIFSHNNTNSYTENLNTYNLFIEKNESKSFQKNVLGIGKFNIEYEISSFEQLYLRTQFKKTNNYRNDALFYLIDTMNNSILTDETNGASYLNQNIEWHKKQSKKHIFSATVNYTFDKNNPNKFWNTTNPVLEGLIPFDTNQNENKLKQLKENKKDYLHLVFKDFWILNNRNHIYTTIGNTNQVEKFVSTDYQILDDGSKNNFTNANFNNSTKFKHNDFFTGVHYKFITGIFTLKQGVYLHHHNWSIIQLTEINNSKWVVLPDFLMKIEFNNSKKIQLNYNLKSNFSNASNLTNRFYLKSYNSVYKGNPNLENELFHSARIRYSKFSLYRGLTLSTGLSYVKKIDGYRNLVEFDGINQFLTVQMLENPSENWSVNTSIRKRIKLIRYKATGNFSNSKYLQGVDNKFNNNINENFTFNLGAETLFESFPNIEVGFEQSIGNYTSSNSTSKFITNQPYLYIDYDFLEGFIFSFEYENYNYENKTFNQKNTYQIANSTLSYKNEDSAWSFKIDAQNLFNVKYKQQNSFSSYIISDTKTYILPRIIMFSIGYNL